MLERCGYPLVRDDAPPPRPTEMESLTNWLLSERSRLCDEQPSFIWFRDIAILTKFLCTMETREAEQQVCENNTDFENKFMFFFCSVDVMQQENINHGDWLLLMVVVPEEDLELKFYH